MRIFSPKQLLRAIVFWLLALQTAPAGAADDDPERQASDLRVPSNYAFEVLRNGRKIGEHRIMVTALEDGFQVNVRIDLQVNLGPLPVYRYTHENEEIWKAGQLVSIETKTNENSREFKVSGTQTTDGFQVRGLEGEVVVPADILTSTYWNKETVARTAMLDTQRGLMFTYQTADPVYDADNSGQKYALTGDLTIDLWYDAYRLTRMAFDNNGALIEYLPFDTES